VVEYAITPYLIPFKIAHCAYEFATKTHPQTKGFKEIYKSSVIKKNLNPKWPTRKLGFFELCWGDVDLPILLLKFLLRIFLPAMKSSIFRE